MVLHQLHDLRVVGHLGIARTIARVKTRFYWPGLSLDVARWCQKCATCAGRKGKPTPQKSPLTQLPTGAPFDRIAMDILDTHRTTSKKHRYVLVISDYFSKYTDAFPLRRHTAKAVANVLVNRWIVYHGTPKVVHSDQGTEFESSLLRHTIRLLGVRKTRTAPYRPQSDGMVERFNRTLLNMLSAFVSEKVNDWDEHLPYVMMAYRTSVHASTGCTPQIMVYGVESHLPVDLMFPHAEPDELPPCGHEYVEYLRQTIRSTHAFAREHLQKSAVRQKRGYDAHAKARGIYQVGDYVRYYYLPLTQGNKFARPWTGPWKIIAKPTEIDYTIELVSNTHKTRTVHFDVLKMYEGDNDDVLPHESTDTASDFETEPAVPLSDVDIERRNENFVEAVREMYEPWNITTHDHTDDHPSDDETQNTTSNSEGDDTDEAPIARRLRPRRVPEDARRKAPRDKTKSPPKRLVTPLSSDDELADDLPEPSLSSPRALRPRRELRKPARYR